MKIQNFEYLTQLTVLPTLFPINFYLIKENTGLTLIDAGTKRDSKKIITYVKKKNLEIKRIILTHAHSDHVGDLKKIKESFPNVSVYLSKKEQLALKNSEGKNLVSPSVSPDYLVEEGDQIGSLKVIDLEGHTPGSVGLLDTRTEYLIAGDLFQTRGRFAIAGDRVWSFPFVSIGTWNHDLAVQSFNKVKTMKIQKVFCGHGEALNQRK